MKKATTYYVYILSCADGTLYTGITNDIASRLKKHNSGKGAKAIRGKLPVTIVYTQRKMSKGNALRREAEIKRMSRTEKLKLIEKTPVRKSKIGNPSAQ